MMMHQNSQSGQPPQPMMFMPGQHGQPGLGTQQPGHSESISALGIFHIAYLPTPVPPGRGGYPQQQPHFSSPHQGHHFPASQHRNPSNGFNQGPQIPPQMPANVPANPGSRSQSAEATDEGK